MKKITNKKFNQLVEKKLRLFEKAKGAPLTRQSKATKRGTLLEDVAVLLLKTHPNVKSIETQVFKEEVDEFSLIDIVVHTQTGNTVYIPVARDLWLGTSQQDRLHNQALKYKGGILDKYNYCYLVGDDFAPFVKQKCTKAARKKPTVQGWVKKLHKAKMLHTFESLWKHLGNL